MKWKRLLIILSCLLVLVFVAGSIINAYQGRPGRGAQKLADVTALIPPSVEEEQSKDDLVLTEYMNHHSDNIHWQWRTSGSNMSIVVGFYTNALPVGQYAIDYVVDSSVCDPETTRWDSYFTVRALESAPNDQFTYTDSTSPGLSSRQVFDVPFEGAFMEFHLVRISLSEALDDTTEEGVARGNELATLVMNNTSFTISRVEG